VSKWLITGASGLLGSRLCENLAFYSKQETLGIINTHKLDINKIKSVQLDLTETELVNDIFKTYQPDITVHCAALTNVDYCETNEDEAYELNTKVSENFSNLCAENNSKFVFISTDQLWAEHTPWITEETPISPVNVYGKTKAAAEKIVLRNEDSLVLRTNFFGKGPVWGASLLDNIVSTLKANNVFRGFNDVYFSPISVNLLVDNIVNAVNNSLSGLYHLAGSERLSKYEFSIRVADYFSLNKTLIEEVSVESIDFLAKRPSEMSLSTDKVSKALGYKMPDIQTSLNSLDNQQFN